MAPPLFILVLALVVMAAAPLLAEDLDHCLGLSSCIHGGQFVPHGTVLANLPDKCMRIVCDKGSAVPEFVGDEKASGCCEFRGNIYQPGLVYPAGCAKMTCEGGNWKPTGEIETHCPQCEVFDDPHFWSYDRHRFDYHGDCKYAISQKGNSIDPEYGIFAQFQRCYNMPSCVQKTTFKDNPELQIEIGEWGLASPGIFKIRANGEEIEVPAGPYAQRVTAGGVKHNVLVWRQGECLRILGSQGLVLQHCKIRFDVWANPNLHSELRGLCGIPDKNTGNDFTTRNNVPYNPTLNAPAVFAESWKTPDQTNPACTAAGRRRRSINKESQAAFKQCQQDNVSWKRMLALCQQTVGGAKSNGQGASGELSQVLVDSCAFDLCMISKGSPDPEKDTEKWLGEVKVMTKERVFIETMVVECDREKGQCEDLPKEVVTTPNPCTNPIDLIFNPGCLGLQPIRHFFHN
nr:otogelin-like protein [Procambarus clarkii]XP_045610360.1 otogelin-like protein [Procambarus clarkii]